jgi:hypothetical protein
VNLIVVPTELTATHLQRRLYIGANKSGDLKNMGGVTAAEIMKRKRDPEFREMAAQLLAES